jgi:hypothetical protein
MLRNGRRRSAGYQISADPNRHHDEQRQPDGHEAEAQNLGAERQRARGRVHQVLLQVSAFHQALVFDGVFALELFERHRTGEHDHVERELVRPPVIHEIVHGEQISGGKYGLVAMGDCGDIEYPSPPVARGELAGRFQNCPRATALRARSARHRIPLDPGKSRGSSMRVVLWVPTVDDFPCFFPETGRFSKKNREAIEHERAITERD